MAWLRLDDGFAEHPKVLALELELRWSWLEVLLYCARRRSGRVTRPALERLGIDADGVAELLRLELLEDVDGELVVHDWHAYNGAKSGAERTAEWRDRKYGPARYSRGGRRGTYAGSGSTASSVTESDGNVTSPERLHVRAGSPSPDRTTPTSDVDSRAPAVVEEGFATVVGLELSLSRLLGLLGELDEGRLDYIRGAAGRLPESVTVGLLERLTSGAGAPVRDRVGYVVGAYARELRERGLS